MTEDELASLNQVFAFHEKLIQKLRNELRYVRMEMGRLKKTIRRIGDTEHERRSRASRQLKELLTQLLEEKNPQGHKLPSRKRNTTNPG